MIENDWAKLYMNLPFYPERGAQIKKRDIDDVYYNIYRGDVLKVYLLYNLKLKQNFFYRKTS